MDQPLLEVRDLKKHFPINRGIFSKTVGYVRAVDGVSLNIRKGETLGLVGESGCGKTTAGRTILRLIEATGGEVRFDGQDVLNLDKKALRAIRRRMQIIFQDPYSSLNPRMTVGGMLNEALTIHKLTNGSGTGDRIAELLETVGLRPDYSRRYPHEFSGGQRQRIGIARALAVSPDFIVADEPVSALDVSIQAQIINLFKKLKKDGMTLMLISHDLAVLSEVAEKIGIMYGGKMVEFGSSSDIFEKPKHPYTIGLLESIPRLHANTKPKFISGIPPDLLNAGEGCRFIDRCPEAMEKCKQTPPKIFTESGYVLCWLYE